MAKKLGDLGDALFAHKAKIAAANATVEQLEQERKLMEDELIQRMEAEGTDIVRGKKATISISENIRPQIADWDKLIQFVIRKKAVHLFERRISVMAYREMKESLGNKDVPGLTEFKSQRINVRKL